MAKPRWIVVSCLCLALALPGLAAAGKDARPSRFVPDLDRQLVSVENPLDGSTWAAWTFRNGSQTDVAVSHLDADGMWSEPQLIGAGDALSQRQPALAVDGYGTTYLAYAERGTGRVFVTARGFSSREWTPAAVISPAGVRADAPALMIAANRTLVVGYTVNGRVELEQLPLLPPVIVANGNDGPDPLADGVWPPAEPPDDSEDDDSMHSGETFDEEVVYTGPIRGRRND